MKKIFTLFAASAASLGTAFAAAQGPMNFVGKADFYVTTMKDNSLTNISKDTVTVNLGQSSDAAFTIPKMVYGKMVVPSFTISNVPYTMTGSFPTGDMVFTWDAANLSTTVTDNGAEKTVSIKSLKATYTHTTGELVFTMEYQYGGMPMSITYENTSYYTQENNWQLVGRGTISNPYKIYDAADFLAMAKNISAENTGKGEYFVMMNNVDFGGTADSPVQLPAIGKGGITNISNISYGFDGTFDANNDTISGIYHTNCGNDADGKFNALFASVTDNGVIKNLVFSKDNSVKSYSYVAPIASVCSGKIDNCTNYTEVTAANFAAGGIVGATMSAANISNCKNYADISAMTYAAGIDGGSATTKTTADNYATISNCINYGNIKTTNGTGAAGIAGSYAGSIVDCVNNGNIDDSEGTAKSKLNTAGIVSCASKVLHVSNCTNNGEVKGEKNVGGIVGNTQSDVADATVDNCTNNGTVSGNSTNVSGIIANTAFKTYKVTVSNCTNNAAVTTEQEDKTTIGNLCGNSAIVLGEGNVIKDGLTLYQLDPTYTGIKDINAAETNEATAKAVKFFKSGTLVIVKNGKTYSVAGTEM